MDEQTRRMICIRCPIGCRLTLTIQNGMLLHTEGAGCMRGEAYAQEEISDPRRIVTTIMRVHGSKYPVSVRSTQAVPKGAIAGCLQRIAEERAPATARAGDILIADVMHTGADIIATADARG